MRITGGSNERPDGAPRRPNRRRWKYRGAVATTSRMPVKDMTTPRARSVRLCGGGTGRVELQAS